MDGLAIPQPAFLFVRQKGWLEMDAKDGSITHTVSGHRGLWKVGSSSLLPSHTGSMTQKHSHVPECISWPPTQAVYKSNIICCSVHTACKWQQKSKSFPDINTVGKVSWTDIEDLLICIQCEVHDSFIHHHVGV